MGHLFIVTFFVTLTTAIIVLAWCARKVADTNLINVSLQLGRMNFLLDRLQDRQHDPRMYAKYMQETRHVGVWGMGRRQQRRVFWMMVFFMPYRWGLRDSQLYWLGMQKQYVPKQYFTRLYMKRKPNKTKYETEYHGWLTKSARW